MKHTFESPEDWVEHYGNYLYAIAFARLNQRTQAEDAVQDTFLDAWKNRQRFDGRVEFKFWLRGILRKKVVDIIRKNSREIPFENLAEAHPGEEQSASFDWVLDRKVESFSFDPSKAMQTREFWQVFRICLQRLKHPLHDIYLLKEIEHEKTDKLCKDFNISQSNLWVMMHRARQQLKSCLEYKWGRR